VYHPHLLEKVLVGDILDLLESLIQAGEKYDCIVCNNVLEHVVDPVFLLNQLRKLMQPNGLVRIVVPNDGSWLQKKIVDKKMAVDNYWVCPPDHLSYFTTDALTKTVEACKFKVVDLLATFPVDIFLLNPHSNYQQIPHVGRECHFARVEFELALWKESLDKLISFRRGCAQAGVGRDLVLYASLLGDA
jgi:SAM-dependent methyltransferase